MAPAHTNVIFFGADLSQMCAQHHRLFRIRVFGTVQGVGFRAYVRREARTLGLRGYVRNLEDGSVEIVAVGPKNALETLVDRVKGAVPPIRVTSLKVEEEEPKQQFSDFVILR